MNVTPWTIQLKKGMAEFIILLSLGKGEAYGYQILQALVKVDHLAFGESTVYPILSRLAAEDYLSVRVVESQKGPPRRYYRLTAAGRRRLEEMDLWWEEFVNSVDSARKDNHHGHG